MKKIYWAGFLVILFASLAWGQVGDWSRCSGKRVIRAKLKRYDFSCHLEDVSLQDFVQKLNTDYDLKFVVDPQLLETRHPDELTITFYLRRSHGHGVTLKAGFELILSLLDLRYWNTGQEIIIYDDGRTGRHSRGFTGKTYLFYGIEEHPLPEVIRQLRNFSTLDIVLDPMVLRMRSPEELRVRLAPQKITWQRMLEQITVPLDLDYRILDGQKIYITEKRYSWRREFFSKLKKWRYEDSSGYGPLPFENRPISEVIQHLGRFYSINIVIDPRVRRTRSLQDMRVSLEAKPFTLESLLDQISEQLDLDYHIEDEKVLITLKR
ncbi:MAG: DUF4974 domain-containing protein [Planctomycetota bacterium]|nr:DUF4974 domain-containing protein [Planctomycetota bacterium]